MLLIGLAAGTVSELFTDVYGPLSITGVELDPAILEVGERYFDMTQPNLTAIAADGRTWLAGQPDDTRFDLIAVDAYRPPYIPFHLATREFFQLAYDHLTEDGVLAINVGRTANNFSLVDALATTVARGLPVGLCDRRAGAAGRHRQLAAGGDRAADLAGRICRPTSTHLGDEMPGEFRDFAAEASVYARVAHRRRARRC